MGDFRSPDSLELVNSKDNEMGERQGAKDYESVSDHGIIYKPFSVEERLAMTYTILPELQSVKKIGFSGGEPVLMVEHYKILQYLIANKKTDVELSYNTNMSVLGYKTHNIIDYWKKFSNITVNVSIDSEHEQAEYIRSGIKWDDIEKNFKVLMNECTHVKINILSSISVYNAFSIFKFHQDWIKCGKILPEQIRIKPVIEPSHLSLQILPAFFKQQISVLIDKHMKFLLHYENSEALIKNWNDIKAYMLLSDESYKLTEFFTFNDRLDDFRKESFSNVFPEYKNLCLYL